MRVLGDQKQVLAESQPLARTVSDADVRWLDDSALAAIKTRRARLQLVFQQATVFSFSQGNPNGSSRVMAEVQAKVDIAFEPADLGRLPVRGLDCRPHENQCRETPAEVGPGHDPRPVRQPAGQAMVGR